MWNGRTSRRGAEARRNVIDSSRRPTRYEHCAILPQFIYCVAIAVVAGCGGGANGSAGEAAADYTRVRMMTGFYEGYLAEHRNPPRNEQAFREYLAKKQDQLEKAGLSMEEMFASPRNGKPLMWVYGGKPPVGPNGMNYYAYEKEPVNGKRLVLGGRGMYEEIDETRFKAVFRSLLKS